jgi:phosphomannomutase / phosphoglucomutase
MSQLQPGIFREYDIRGIAATELDNDVVEKIASAVAAVYVREGKRTIVIGMDGRTSSPRIRDVFAATLARYGLQVVDIGLVPTPVVYFANVYYHYDGAVVITASHNPGEYNGFKVLSGKGALFGERITELYRLAAAGTFPPPLAGGTISKKEVLADYLDYICANVKLDKKLKVVVDGGNGTGGITAGPLFRRLGAEVIEIFCTVDGTFPNHHPDPTKEENLRDLIARVKQEKADLGIGLDGDADRIGVVDSQGHILWGDQLMVIFARDIIKTYPGATVISEVKASQVLYDELKKMGAHGIMYKTGHSLIKQKIVDENAKFAGEMSGHIFFNDKWFGFDDAVYAGARLLELLSRGTATLDDIRQTIPQTCNTPELRVDTTEAAKFAIVAAVLAHYTGRYPIIDIDGARIQFPHGWGLVRASNTQPALVVRFEADTAEHLREIQSEVEGVLAGIKQREESRS